MGAREAIVRKAETLLATWLHISFGHTSTSRQHQSPFVVIHIEILEVPSSAWVSDKVCYTEGPALWESLRLPSGSPAPL